MKGVDKEIRRFLMEKSATSSVSEDDGGSDDGDGNRQEGRRGRRWSVGRIDLQTLAFLNFLSS